MQTLFGRECAKNCQSILTHLGEKGKDCLTVARLVPYGSNRGSYGAIDNLVPLIVGQDYAQKARVAGDTVILLELPGEDHFVVIDPASQAWELTCEEIDCLLA